MQWHGRVGGGWRADRRRLWHPGLEALEDRRVLAGPSLVEIVPVAPDPRATPVDSIDVIFSGEIDQSTFAPGEDFWLERARTGERVPLGAEVSVVQVGPATYRVAGLGPYTGLNGEYVFRVDASGVAGPGGEAGHGALDERFVVDTVGPGIRWPQFHGPNRRNRPVETIGIISWDGDIDLETLTLDDVELTRDGVAVPMTGGMVVDVREIQFPVGFPNGPIPPPYVTAYVYVLSGLAGYTGEPGEYRAEVSMAGVSDLAGNPGSGSAATTFTFDPVGPWLELRIEPRRVTPLRGPLTSSLLIESNIGYTGELTREALTLTRDRVPVPLPDEVRIVTNGPSRRIVGLESATRLSGTYDLTVDATGLVDELGNTATATSSGSTTIVVRRGVVPADYDGDGISDLATYLFDEVAGAGRFDIQKSSDGQAMTMSLGTRGEIPVAGDFDGDGKSDAAVYNPEGRVGGSAVPNAAVWTYIRSSDGVTVQVPFGAPGLLDRPAPGDFDGDGTTDIATFRANSDITPDSADWFIRPTRDPGAAYRVAFGAANGVDLPAVADYDNDFRDDLATFRPSPHPADFASLDPEGDGIGAQWFLHQSTAGAARVEFGAASGQVLGRPADQPAPADWNGDGRADITAFRVASDLPGTTGQTAWFHLRSSASRPTYEDLSWFSTRSRFVGAAGDLAAPADYNGDGWPDFAVFDPAARRWTILDGQDETERVVAFGPPGTSTNVMPVLAPLYFRLVATGNPVDGVGSSGGGDGLTRFAGAPGRPRVTGGNAPAYASLGGLAGFGLASAGSAGAATSVGATAPDREEAIDLALEDWA